VNIGPSNAKWIYQNSMVGDTVSISGTPRHVAEGNGWTAWTLSWRLHQGKRRARHGECAEHHTRRRSDPPDPRPACGRVLGDAPREISVTTRSPRGYGLVCRVDKSGHHGWMLTTRTRTQRGHRSPWRWLGVLALAACSSSPAATWERFVAEGSGSTSGTGPADHVAANVADRRSGRHNSCL